MRLLTALVLSVAGLCAADLEKQVEHGYAVNNGVKIHYASLGKGPLVVMIHGFPDYWYSWRHQMQGSPNSSRWSPSTSAATTSPTNPRAWKTMTCNCSSPTWLR